MVFVEGETGYCSETWLTCDVDGTADVSITAEDAIDIKEEVSIKLQEAIDIKDEMPEATSYPPIKTEHEVRLWGVCEVLAADAFRPFIATKRPALCHVLCHMPFEIWNAILKLRDFCEVTAINRRIILKCISKK
jgi:hypothetical protein